jgi:hypothetical protein
MRVTKFLNTKETFFCKFELQPLDIPNSRNPTLCSIWIQGKDVKPHVSLHKQGMTLDVNGGVGSIYKVFPHDLYSFKDALKYGFDAVFRHVSDHWISLNPNLIDYDKFLENPHDLSSYYDIKRLSNSTSL